MQTATTDIEHVTVTDDPRAWSRARKWTVLATVSAASLIAGLGGNIYNPAIPDIQRELNASDGTMALSLSLYAIFQGGVPLLWSALSEFGGRKNVYLLSTALCLLGCIVAAVSKTIGVLVGMRCIQAIGCAPHPISGTATDLRGTSSPPASPLNRPSHPLLAPSAPVLGPSLGPIIGGALTDAFDWRATFWFLAAFVALVILAFLPFRDTFRRERSLTYQAALRRRRAQRDAKDSEASSATQQLTTAPPAASETATSSEEEEKRAEVAEQPARDVEKQEEAVSAGEVPAPLDVVKLSLADVNPLKPVWKVLRRTNNIAILVASGLTFGFIYCISYTCALTLSHSYGYSPMTIGLVLLSFGIGSLLGSLLGGRYSDYVFRNLKARNGGTGYPEMRLQSTLPFMPVLPLAIVGYGWVCEERVHVAAVCAMLFLSSFFDVCIYTSTLAYIVDANAGRSSPAVAMNSAFRGLAAFVGAEVAVPLQNAIGDGGSYSLWAGLILLSELLIVLVWWRGKAWRERWEQRERRTAGA
ncbi:major facilitator superfamily domain-containing protein [Daedaleopsis nitida]|nr:major facilitator superfamily domain-containing protein [Daedaleopsis nitida]